MATIQVERRKRGIFGWCVAIVFWGFNALMAWMMITAFRVHGEVAATTVSTAETAGATIGTGLAVTVILWIWLFGAIILGLMMYFTRGRRIIETIEK
jgi:hypothetical protein